MLSIEKIILHLCCIYVAFPNFVLDIILFMKVTILKRERLESVSCYLIFHQGGKRVQYNTGIKLHKVAPRGTKAEKENKEREKLLQTIRDQKEKDLLLSHNGVKVSKSLDGVSLRQLVESFINSAKSSNTRKSRFFLRPLFADGLDLQIKKIDSYFLKESIEKIKQDQSKKDTTRKSYIIILLSFVHYWQKKGIFPSNILYSIDTSLKTHQEKRHYLTREQISEIETYWKESPLPTSYRAVIGAFLFGCYTGLRLSDIEKFKESESVKGGFIELHQIKTSEIVKIPYTDKARYFLEGRESFDLHSREKTRYVIKRLEKHLFPSLGWSLSFHISRHSFAVNAITAKVDLYSVSRLLGHTSIKTTQVYADLSEEKAKEELDKLTSYLGG